MIEEKDLPIPSLIILKNSVKEDVIPSPEELEIGEIALSLFPGQEALWVKNRDGEVLNIRKPESNLLWDGCFSIYPSRLVFDQDLSEGKIDENKLYFITLEKEIWAKGEFYGCDYDPSELDKIVDQRLVSIPLDVIFLDPKVDTNKEIETAWGGVDKFKSIAIAIFNNKTLATVDTSHAKASVGNSISISIPVSVSAQIKSSEEIIVGIDGVYDGVIYHSETLYKNGVFGIQNYKQTDLVNIEKTLDKFNTRLHKVEDALCWIEED